MAWQLNLIEADDKSVLIFWTVAASPVDQDVDETI